MQNYAYFLHFIMSKYNIYAKLCLFFAFYNVKINNIKQKISYSSTKFIANI